MHILFADDHALLRDTLAAWLRARQVKVTCVPSLAAAQACGDRPDLLLLDLRLSDLVLPDGIAALRVQFGAVPILLMAGAHDAQTAQLAQQAGCAEILPKALPPSEVLAALRRHVGVGDLADVAPLTARESEVLQGLAAGLSNKEIARDLTLQEVTVKLHLQRLSRKLGVRNRTQAVLRARDLGLV